MPDPDKYDVPYTAYQTGGPDKWTVWDHINDRLVAKNLTEQDAKQKVRDLTN